MKEFTLNSLNSILLKLILHVTSAVKVDGAVVLSILELCALMIFYVYSKTCLKWPLKIRQNKGLNVKW